MFPIWEKDGLDLDFLKEVVDHLQPLSRRSSSFRLKEEGNPGVLAGIGLPPGKFGKNKGVEPENRRRRRRPHCEFGDYRRKNGKN